MNRARPGVRPDDRAARSIRDHPGEEESTNMGQKDTHKITLEQLASLLLGLGIAPDVNDVMLITIEPGKATVVRKRRDERGRSYVLPGTNEIATETTTIAIGG